MTQEPPEMPEPAIVIGTMKSGTTSLFDRLSMHPAIHLPQQKEPNYFSTEYHRGWAWYERLRGDVAPGAVPLDASVSYTLPAHAEEAAKRICSDLPDARLVVLLRHPVDRLRAHYLHEVQRRREGRPFLEAVVASSPYVMASDYALCLRPYLEGPLRHRLLGLRTEDLDDADAWARLLEHLRLPPMPLPQITSNIGAEKQPFSRIGAGLWNRGWLDYARLLPKPLRRRLRRFAFAPGDRAELCESAGAPVPRQLREQLLSSAHQAGEQLDLDTTAWAAGSERG